MPQESVPSPRPARTPGELARETLKVLASRRIAPTPENYVQVYAEIAGTPAVAMPGRPAAAGADPTDWSQVIRDLLRQLEVRHAAVSLSQKREGLERLLISFRRSPQLGDKLASMVKAWGEALPSAPGALVVDAAEDAVAPAGAPFVATAAVATAAVAPAPWQASPVFNGIAATNPPASDVILLPMVQDLAQTLRELLAGVFEREVAPRISDYPKLAGTVSRLPSLVRAAATPADCAAVDTAIGHALREAELVQVEQRLIVEDSMALVRMLVANLAELVDDDRWVAGQVQMLERTVAQPPTSRTLADAQAQFRETAERQRALKQALREMKRTLKELIGVFVERVGEMARSAVDYQTRIVGYTERVRVTENVNALRDVLDDLMVDIRRMQIDATRSRDDVLGVSEQATRARAKVAELEAELARVSAALREDALTGALNRRGLDEAVEREASRAQRYRSPLSFAMMDLDNFKKLNDRLGHQAGDEALRHLVSVVRTMLRPSDTIGRYGGEEFVLLLPETPLADAKIVIERLQRELTRQFFLHNNEKVLITFSAGVSRMHPGEAGALALARADEAMYRAKRKGRNRVMLADGD
ncbi:MAG: diguanylate cyclase [Betaproteobacteria bacterium]|jgi:diguanylate cyclase|nr:diguanylate cyclase [Betaproteobacteria bacterium]